MATTEFDAHLREAAIRALLRTPLLRRADDEETFREIATRRSALSTWFRDNLGWALTVDIRAGVARLHKRRATPDARRGLRTRRSNPRPFDRKRYQLLALTCAQMLRRPHSTLGNLADALTQVCNASGALQPLDFTKQSDRRAFVDVLLWLIDAGAIQVTAGEVEGYARSTEVNAVLRANTTVLPLLLSSDTSASRLDLDDPRSTPADWVGMLCTEPRYGTAPLDPEGTDRVLRNQWARHTALRALLDDPVVDIESLHPTLRAYLATPAGRDKALSVAEEAGFVVERHADVWLAIDPTGESSPNRFSPSGRGSKVQQTAALILRTLVSADDEGRRRRVTRSRSTVEATVDDALRQNPAWAKTARAEGGPKALCSAALDLLEEFGLVQCEGDQIAPRPAAARFTVEIDA